MKARTKKGLAVTSKRRRRPELNPGDYYKREIEWDFDEGPEYDTAYGAVLGDNADEDVPGVYEGAFVRVFEWADGSGESHDPAHDRRCFDTKITRDDFEAAVPEHIRAEVQRLSR